MKKIFLTAVIVLLSAVMVHSNADAISGVCSNCHTMHNSQDGAVVDSGGPNERLLKTDCIGCHSTSTGKTSSFGGPAVLHTTAPTGQGAGKTLAGGDFYWVNADETTNAAKGHNVLDLVGVTGKDTNMPNFTPPGWDAAATGSSFAAGQVAGGEGSWTSQLTCAGKYGCHGDHTVTDGLGAVGGAHHGNTGGTATQASTADTMGNSYRFLWGIKGLENSDWNWSETATTHNEYYGEANTADRTAGGLASYGSRDTISFLCSECHGVFHGSIDQDSTAGSPWVRHPTDIVLTCTGTEEYCDYTGYSLEAPIARPTVPATSNATVTPGTDIVMCLSCHRAHGSPENDLLRWTYSGMVAGGGATNGCFTCHTAKN